MMALDDVVKTTTQGPRMQEACPSNIIIFFFLYII